MILWKVKLMTIKDFREYGKIFGLLNDGFGLAINDAEAGYINLFVIDNFNHTLIFNNINTKYNRKYFLAEPDKIVWKYNKETFEIEGLTKDVFEKYVAKFTEGIKTVKNRIKIKKLNVDFTNKPHRPSRRRTKRPNYC